MPIKKTVPDDLPDLLKEAGLRVTGPRLLILSSLQTGSEHPTPEQLFDTLKREYPSLSMSTVYHTLEAFLRAGLCRRISAPDGRLRVDGTAQDHDHAVCRSCGAIFDVERRKRVTPVPPATLPDGLEVVGVRVEYEVICSDCAPGPAESRTAGRSRPAQ